MNKTQIDTRKWAHFHKDRTKLAQDCKGYLVVITCGTVTCDDYGRFKRDTGEKKRAVVLVSSYLSVGANIIVNIIDIQSPNYKLW